jgi:hypothetical protein
MAPQGHFCYHDVMASLWSGADSERIRTRIGRLVPDAFPRWGSYTAPQMVCHLCDSLRLTMGEIQVEPTHKLLHYQPLKALSLYLLPIPKNARSAPELRESKPGEWLLDIATLLELLDQCTQRPENDLWGRSPVYGWLTKGEWGVAQYRHFDHHLRQFGC